MINYTKRGNGPALILIHGFCESLEMWAHWMPTLAQTHCVYAIDLPGFGKSPLIESTISMESTAVILQEWLDQEGISDPTIIGHSLGGYVTLAMAELMGIGIKGIGLFHSTAFADTEEKKHTRNKTHQFIRKFGVEKFIDSFVPSLFSEENRLKNFQEIELLIQAGRKSSKEGVLAYILAMRDRKDRMDIWQNFPNPKLVIAGYYDLAVNIEQSRLHKPYTQFYHELPHAGHMGMFEASETTLKLLQNFLKQL
ncbi:MAG: alpha/beta fold hydrolase [Mongoliitalea sp.]